MSGYVPKRVRNANIRLTSNQRGLKLQGLAPSIGLGRVLTRYTKSRVKSGVVVTSYPTGYRCINGVDPKTASEHALECNCDFVSDPTYGSIWVPPAPLTQANAGGVGRINAPRFHCGSTCEASNEPGNPNRHPHYHPPHTPIIPPSPIPGGNVDYTITIAHYGLAGSPGNQPYSKISSGIRSDSSTEDKFRQYCNNYIKFINKLVNTPHQSTGDNKYLVVDRVLFNINDSPSIGVPGSNSPQIVDYSTLVTKDTASSSFRALASNEVWVYKYFIKPVLLQNYNGGWGPEKRKIQVGLTFSISDGWNTFNSNPTGNTGPLPLNLDNNYATNNGNLKDKTDPLQNGTMNQTFRYVRYLNDFINNDNDFQTIRANYPQESLYWLITSISYDTEGNQGGFPDTKETINNLWEQQFRHTPIQNAYNWSATSTIGNSTLGDIPNSHTGPDRLYREIYDTFDNSAYISGQKAGGTKYCDIHSGSGGPGTTQNGWDVKPNDIVKDYGTSTISGLTDINDPRITWNKFNNQRSIIGSNLCCNCGTQATELTQTGPDSNGLYTYSITKAENATSCPSGCPNSYSTNTGIEGSKYLWLATKANQNTLYQQPLKGDITSPFKNDYFNFKKRLANAPNGWGQYRGQGITEGNGAVMMFSIQNKTGTENVPGSGGKGSEDAFGNWTYDQFIKFLGEAAKFLNKNNYSKPILGIYEYDFVPSSWIEN